MRLLTFYFENFEIKFDFNKLSLSLETRKLPIIFAYDWTFFKRLLFQLSRRFQQQALDPPL
jgi:hypothetical protein